MSITTRSNEIQLFEAFKKALKELNEKDIALFLLKKNHIAINHRLACYLENRLKGDFLIDISYPIGSYNPDIIVHNRNGKVSLAIWWQDDYMNKHLREEAKRFHEEYGCLTIAVSSFSLKNYYLIYRFASSYTDYLHISRENFTERLVKKVNEDGTEEKEQLLLDIKKKKTKKKKATSLSGTEDEQGL